jgi:hypothetical protein
VNGSQRENNIMLGLTWAMVLLGAVLAVAGCSTASAPPSAGSSPVAATSPDSTSSPGGASAYFNCLREHGVTGFGRGGASTPSPGTTPPSSSTIASARQACASLRPSGGFGGSGDSSGSSAVFAKFKSCLSSHGVTLPSPSATSGGGFRDLFSQLRSNPTDQAAFSACKSDLPSFKPGGGYGGGSSSGGGGSTGS